MLKRTKKAFIVGSQWEIGKAKGINQDHILVKIGEDDGHEFGLFAVADGMGGLAAGEFASELTIQLLSRWWETRLHHLLIWEKNPITKILEELESLIKEINCKILIESENKNIKMGTTLSVLFLHNRNYCLAHIGDSRIYKIDDWTLSQLTEDHSYVATLVEKGLISSEEAKIHPNRNLLTKCLGITPELEAFYRKGSFAEGEGFLLSSDGFYTLLHDDEILKVIKKYRRNIKKGLKLLTKLVYDRGAFDNLSVIYVGGFEEASLYSKLKNILEITPNRRNSQNKTIQPDKK